MSFKVSGYNAFYEGWLARVFGLPKVCMKSDDIEAWIDGWEMADETGPGIYTALGMEITRNLGHILIKEVP
jgi:hypothetical protein